MTLFYSLEQVVSSKEGTFPENMLFQGLLIPECIESHRDSPARFQSQRLRSEGTMRVPFPLPPTGSPSFILQTSKMGFSLLYPSMCGRSPVRTSDWHQLAPTGRNAQTHSSFVLPLVQG